MLHGTAWLLLATACASTSGSPPPSSPSPGDRCTVIEREQDVPACVGKTVTLRGVVTRTKIPTLLGVDVDSESAAGEPAEATGVLATYTIPEEAEHEAMPSAHKGPGTYYALHDPSGQGLAKAVKR